jgi:hypothetical protein
MKGGKNSKINKELWKEAQKLASQDTQYKGSWQDRVMGIFRELQSKNNVNPYDPKNDEN